MRGELPAGLADSFLLLASNRLSGVMLRLASSDGTVLRAGFGDPESCGGGATLGATGLAEVGGAIRAVAES